MNEQAVTRTDAKRDIRTLIQSDAVKAQLALVLPKHLTADRMARVACTAILKTPKLLQCKPESLLQALMLCSQAGLEPDGRNAHLIPFGDQVQVIFDYKGLVALAERNGVESIYADRVCENDEFNAWVEDGTKKLSHKVDWRKPRGKAFAYYASCRRNGRLDYEVMTRDDVDAIRQRSRASSSGPWVTDYDEMGKKTVLRRMSKRWDLNPEISDVINADDDTPTPLTRQPSVPVHTLEIGDALAPEPPPTQPVVAPTPAQSPAPAEPKKRGRPAKTETQPVAAPAAPAPVAQTPPTEPTEPPASPDEPPFEEPPGAEVEAAKMAEEAEVHGLVEQIGKLAADSKVTEDQVVAFCKANRMMAGMSTQLSDMTVAKLKLLVSNWQFAVQNIAKFSAT